MEEDHKKQKDIFCLRDKKQSNSFIKILGSSENNKVNKSIEIKEIKANFENKLKQKILENAHLRVENENLRKINLRFKAQKNKLDLSLRAISDDLFDQIKKIRKIKKIEHKQKKIYQKIGTIFIKFYKKTFFFNIKIMILTLVNVIKLVN